MGRKDRNKPEGRGAQGGLRKTDATRNIPSSYRTGVTRSDPDFFEPDVSAFEFTPVVNRPVNVALAPEIVAPARSERLPGRKLTSASPTNSRGDSSAKKRALARKAEALETSSRLRGSALGVSPRHKEAPRPRPARAKSVANPQRGSAAAVDYKKALPKLRDKKLAGRSELARRDVSHEVRSPARVSKSQVNCQPRPDNKASGKAGAKKIDYIPWCEIIRKKH